MRHLVAGKKLGRDQSARRALLVNLASSLFERGQITTTLSKAKFARPYAEKLITVAKHAKHLDTQRRISTLLTKNAFTKLRTDIAPGFKTRNGGYTRIIRLINRKGDSAPLARLELLKTEGPERSRRTETSSPGTHPGGEAKSKLIKHPRGDKVQTKRAQKV